MEKVRIGNDLRVNFSVYRNGEQESFDGATNISTKIVNESYNKTIAHTYSIVDNVIQFNIDALELKQCGKCRVFISYTKDGDYTVDSPAFELVQYTEDTGGTEVIGIEIVKINISGDIGINRDGASAYEVWESYSGNEGKTIEQYFEWLRENPTKIDLDGLNSNLDKLHFKPDTLVQLTNIGDVRYSPESKTLEVKVSDTVSIQLGQEMQTRVKNDESIQINNGQMVYINSAAGANPLAKIASTSNADIAQRTFGMATENIQANRFGAITTEGLVRDINTSAFPEGAMLWLGTNGNVTNIEPTAPTPKISVGMVLRSNANNGVVYVKIRAIARNQKLSDVYAPTLTGGDVLRWNNTTLRFETFNITSALSNKVDTSRTITAGNGLTGGGDLTTDRTINIANADDSLVVAADSVKVNTNNTLTSTSTTQPLSANQGKVLNEKVAQIETDLNENLEPALAEVLNNLHGRIVAFEQLIKAMIFRSLQIDNLDVVKNLTIHGSTNLFLTGVAAPVNLPDFAGQYYIDTANRVGYLALSESIWLKIADAVEVAANSADMASIKNNQEPAMAEIISHLNARILALESIIKNGLFKNTQIDTADIVKSLNLYGGTNLILIRTVAPTEVPDFVGQTYVNTAAGVAYEAVGTTSVSHWKQKTN